MSELQLSGSCLCGSVTYEISGESMHFYHCHCRRCRKATGTGHASNIIMRPDAVAWTTGEHLLSYYKVPDAKRFATTFCKTCGSLMPRIAPDNSVPGLTVWPIQPLAFSPVHRHQQPKQFFSILIILIRNWGDTRI